ncbi:MAG: cytochrome c3 family protein [Planctomycetota bacterium]
MIRNPRFWIAIGSLALVLGIAFSDFVRASPGPLATVHARVSELNGVGSCAECHGGLFGSMTESCLACHDDIGQHIATGRGLHGAIDKNLANGCARCHSDHHGNNFAMVNRQSFAAAGVPDPEKFDHGMIGFDMAGRHLELACVDCHTLAKAPVLPEGGKRYLGLNQDCASCHEDPHDGQMTPNCVQCHSQTSWDALDSEGHEEFLPLVGGHAELSCRECHAADGARALEKIGHGPPRPPRDCASCHESPHATAFVQGVAKLEKKTEGASCATCHLADHESFREKEIEVTDAQHAASGFALELPHHEVTCAECHQPELPTFEERYPGRPSDDCASCHQDVHEGQFKALSCVTCHARTHFEPHLFTVARHEETNLPLTGRHVETNCNDCHKPRETDGPRAFRGVDDTCASCHRDAHRDAFAKFDEELRETEHGSCAACHGTTSFRDLVTPFDHAKFTSFPLDGAHAQETCEACHKRGPEPDRNGRTFGFVEDNFGRHEGCQTCHADPHRGEFDTKEHPREVKGKTGCARCHTTTSFRDFPEGFDHAKWTGFRLDGAHRQASCSSCHTPMREADARGRSWGRAAGNRCADCHDDPHAGQFQRRRGKVNCEKCHDSATSWGAIRFRHNLDSRFRLDESHRKLDCSACHKPERIGKQTVIRYRPLGRKCADCHSTRKNPLRRRAK